MFSKAIFGRFSNTDLQFWAILAFAVIVLVSPLGIMPLLDDEPTRALVSIEMAISKNYWVPTTNGELYLNKPPLFNWLIASLMQLIPDFQEFHLRLPSLLAFFTTAIAIYYLFKKEVGEKVAMYSALAYLTCGRILFVDSMLGYIDPFFSLVIFLNLFFLYKLDVSNKPIAYFLISYSLCLVAFMLKGIPALVFQVASLTVAIYMKGELKKLFSIGHVIGVALFAFILSSYYLIYSSYASVDDVFATLWEQSTKRTISNFRFLDGLLFFIGFPFEFAMHFLPWTLLVVFCFRKDAVRIIRSNQFLKYAVVIFVANILVYWLSPETRPRYLFMFLPFYFAILFYVYENYTTEKQKRIVCFFFFGLSVLLCLASLIPLFLQQLAFIEARFTKSAIVFVLLLILSICIWFFRDKTLALFFLVLLVARLGFNFFVLPSREKEAPESLFKRFASEITSLSKNAPLYLLDATLIDNDISYYISKNNQRILSRQFGVIKEGEFYICQQQQLIDYKLKPIFKFYTNWEHQELFLAIK